MENRFDFFSTDALRTTTIASGAKEDAISVVLTPEPMRVDQMIMTDEMR
jgi:hypothetical protein